MSNQNNSRRWSLCIHDGEDRDFGQEMDTSELEHVLGEELNRDSVNFSLEGINGDCVDVFLYHDSAVIIYTDQNGKKWCSCDSNRFQNPRTFEYVKLSPEDNEDPSFLECSVVSRQAGLHVLKNYIEGLSPSGLYLVDEDSKPILTPV